MAHYNCNNPKHSGFSCCGCSSRTNCVWGQDEYKIKNKNIKDPGWVLQRQPNPDKGETHIQIWFKDDSVKISSSELAQLLADIVQNQVKKESNG